MRSWLAILVMLVIAPASGYGGKFEITENLTPAPAEIKQTIIQYYPSYAHCIISGKYLDLDGDEESTDFVATAKECGGSGGYSIFVFKKEGNSYVEVLLFSGYALTIDNNVTGGLKNITISTEASEGRTLITLWVYNGKHYVKKRGRVLEIFK